ncbi:hypothetical protein [Glycomyces paridis]|uniref:Uncharacterized protein n=1 Tax=Glycomyces paridis TaxID=2126555 RepID=A0A4S8PFD9_9ACTN|nr:hypothetical protein [Glycomyces paridis]THV28365.1 hypothetical protein E9998_12210 [Glycomyces paridis]
MWIAAAVLAVAAAVKIVAYVPANEAITDAQLDTARAYSMDPDLLAMTPFLASTTGLFAVLAYGCSAFFFAMTARSVGRGTRASFALAVFTWTAAAVCCGLQPFVWYRLRTHGTDETRSILDQVADDLPWWLTTVELAALALVALAAVAVGLLLSPAAKAFRLPAPEPTPPTTEWRFRPPRDAEAAVESDAHRPPR